MVVLADFWLDVALPLVAAGVGAGVGVLGTFGYELGLKRREEKRELRAVARLLDAELAAMEGPLTVFSRHPDEPESNSDYEKYKRWHLVALLAQESLSDTVWNETRLLLARHLDFHDWELLRATYGLTDHWWQIDSSTAPENNFLFEQLRLAWNAEQNAPPLLEAIRYARQVCQRHADMPPVQVPVRQRPDSGGASAP